MHLDERVRRQVVAEEVDHLNELGVLLACDAVQENRLFLLANTALLRGDLIPQPLPLSYGYAIFLGGLKLALDFVDLVPGLVEVLIVALSLAATSLLADAAGGRADIIADVVFTALPLLSAGFGFPLLVHLVKLLRNGLLNLLARLFLPLVLQHVLIELVDSETDISVAQRRVVPELGAPAGT